MNFVNQYLQKEPIEKRVLYMELIDEKDDQDIKKYISKDAKNRKLFSFWNLKDKYAEGKVPSNASYIVIDPLKSGTEVKYTQDNEKQLLIPRIKGDINPEAVLRIVDFDEIRNLFDWLNYQLCLQ